MIAWPHWIYLTMVVDLLRSHKNIVKRPKLIDHRYPLRNTRIYQMPWAAGVVMATHDRKPKPKWRRLSGVRHKKQDYPAAEASRAGKWKVSRFNMLIRPNRIWKDDISPKPLSWTGGLQEYTTRNLRETELPGYSTIHRWHTEVFHPSSAESSARHVFFHQSLLW